MHNFLRHGSYLYVIEDINNPYLELGLGVLELVISTIVENDDKLMFPIEIKTKFEKAIVLYLLSSIPYQVLDSNMK